MKFVDAIIVSLFLAAGYGLGSGYAGAARLTHQLPDMPGLSRRVFGAAAMTACGRGATTPVVPARSGPDTPPTLRPLIEFLGLRREAIACADIPPDVPVDGLDGPQRASSYLLMLASIPWRLAGPDWSGIDRLLGLLFAASIGCAYLVGRLAMGRVASAGVAALYMLSPMHLANLLDLRDYSKAPFFAASLLLAGAIVLRALPPAAIVGCAAAAGAILGVGFGVRTDIALNLVVVLGALAFLPGRLADTWKVRVVAALVCVASFAAAATPILRSGASGGNLWHWALLGYARDSDAALDVRPAPYEEGYFYSDSYVATVVDAFWGRTTGSEAQVSVGLPQYAAASERYYLLLLKTFPADALLRGWASVLAVLELPYRGIQSMPRGLVPGVVGRAVALIETLLARGAGIGVPLFVAVALLVSVSSVRLAAFLCGLLGFLGAYPAIQFQPRHVFHLELLPLWVLGYAVSSAGLLIARKTDLAALLGQPDLHTGVWLRRPLLVAAGVAAAVFLPLTTLRAYQQEMATTLLLTYDEAGKDPIALSPAPIGDGDARASLVGALRARRVRRSMQSEMLAVEITGDRCPADRPVLTFRYRAADPAADFSRTYAVERPSAGRVTTVYFPAYQTGETNPHPGALVVEGLEVAESDWPCVKRVSRFAEPDRFPLLLAAVLPGDWRRQPLHQTLRGWEGGSRRDGESPVSYWMPRTLRAQREEILGRLERGDLRAVPAIEFRASIARVDRQSRIDVSGTAESSGSYLVAWKATTIPAQAVLVAEGTLDRGGLTVGFVAAAGWAAALDVTSPGPFRVLVQAPRAGSYQVVVANHLGDGSLENRFTIARIAVVDGQHD